MKKTTSILILVLLLFSGLMTGCGEDEGALLATSAAQTVMVVNAQQTAMAGAVLQMTADAAVQAQAAAPAATLPPVNTPTLAGAAAAAPVAASTQASAPQAASGGDMGQYVSDTIPDGTTYDPGTKFTQTWKLQNMGTSTWTADYAVVFVSGDQMGAPAKVNMPYSISPGMVVEIPVTFTAPTTLGTYKSVWMLENGSGQQFGLGTNNGSFWVQIIVSNLPTATNTPQATATQASGSVDSVAITYFDKTSNDSCDNFEAEFKGHIETDDEYNVSYYWDFSLSGDGTVPDTIEEDDYCSGSLDVGSQFATFKNVSSSSTISVRIVVDYPESKASDWVSLSVSCTE